MEFFSRKLSTASELTSERSFTYTDYIGRLAIINLRLRLISYGETKYVTHTIFKNVREGDTEDK